MDKKTKIIPAFKVSPELHDTIARLSQLSNRKLQDEVRELIALGAQVEEAILKRKKQAVTDVTKRWKRRQGTRQK